MLALLAPEQPEQSLARPARSRAARAVSRIPPPWVHPILLNQRLTDKPDAVNISLHELSREKAMEKVKAKLSLQYHDYLNVFNKAMTDQLSPHRFYDHKIELTGEETSSRSRLYHMFDHKLQKIKNYLIEHLNKSFISFSSTLYASLILFVEKKDESLRFCVNYRKFNALIKRNRYFLLLINETLARI